MRHRIVVCCILLLGMGISLADRNHALKALVPGMGHFDAGKQYHGVAFMTTQIATLYLAIEGFGQRESYAAASQKAAQRVDRFNANTNTGDEGDALWASRRLQELNDSYDRATLQAYLGLGFFGVLYGYSIWDAYRLQDNDYAGSSKFHLDLGFVGDVPGVKFLAQF